MDVRCERCRAHYVFDDAQVTEAGVTVKCSNCGHVFKVKKKALVVTVPVKPGEATEEPITPGAAPPPRAPLAAAGMPSAARTAPHPLPPEKREWRVRQANGNVFTFKELTTLQKWIVEKKVSRDDEISLSGDQWKRLGNIAELAAFFQVVEAAERGQSGPPALTPLPLPPGYQGTGAHPLGYPPGYPPPPQGYPVAAPLPQQPGMPPAAGSASTNGGAPPGAAWESQPPAPPQAVAPEPAWAAGGRRALPDQEVAPERVRPRRSSGGRAFVLLFLLALAGAAAAVWYLKPEWLAAVGVNAPPQAPAPPPPVVQAQPLAKPEPPPLAPAPEPPRAEQPPTVEKAPEMVKEPQMVKEPARPQPRTMKQLLAEAQRLRERGKVEQALDFYGRIVDMHPDSAAALAGRGWCYLDLSQYAPAEASFQAALAADSTHAEALIGLAETYRYEGRRAEAIGYYQKYLAAHPDGEDAVAARNALGQLKE